MKKIILAFLFIAAFIGITGKAQVPSELIGMTRDGGDGFGTIFTIDPSGNNFQLRHTFTPSAPGERPGYLRLCFGPNGKMYGLTQYGGAFNQGLLFEYDTLTNIISKKYDFNTINGTYPGGSVILASDGMLYGLTAQGGNNGDGVLFQFNPVTNVYTKKVDLNSTIGAEPYGSLVQASDGMLYGMTSVGGANGQGVIFQYTPITDVYIKKIDLVTINGIYPHGNLMQASDGYLYGLTYNGGTTGNGALFRYDPVNNVYLKRVDMTATNGAHPEGELTEAPDGNLYSVTQDGGTGAAGAIFRYNPTTNVYTKRYDLSTTTTGKNSTGYLKLASNGDLYGLTYLNGPGSGGILFQYNYTTNALTNRYTFNLANGFSPAGGLAQAPNGKMYGCTAYGGIPATASGTLFRFDPASNVFTLMGTFNTNTGRHPVSSLMQASDGMLYGTTQEGGTNDLGTLFQYNPVTHTHVIKYSFSAPTGRAPHGKLVQASDGNLYGCTIAGGVNDVGVIFQYNPVTEVYTKKIDLSNTLGSQPWGGMIEAFDGKLYGTTGGGGTNFGGVIFQYVPATNTYTVKINLTNATGQGPIGGLLQLADTMIYSTTQFGGLYNLGTLFQYDPRTNIYTKKADFSNPNGTDPFGRLALGNDGKLYGTANYGGNTTSGTIFSFDPATNIFVKRFDLTNATGKFPYGGLLLSSNGKFYGLCQAGGALNDGTIFEFDPVTNACVPKFNFNGPTGWQPALNNDLFEICESIAVQTQPTAITVCRNDSFALNFSASGSNLSYQWYFENVAIPNETSATLNDPQAITADSGTYYCEVTNGCRTVSSTTVTVTVIPAPLITFTLASDSLCITSSAVALSASPAGGIFSGTAVSNNTFDPQAAGTGQFPLTYFYQDTVTGCSNSLTRQITVVGPPVITFSIVPGLICNTEDSLVLNATPSGGTFSGNGISGNEFYPQLAGLGTHLITYTSTILAGCTSTATDTINVLPVPEVNINFMDTVCFTPGLISLSGNPSGGTFSGPGVSASSFDPQSAGPGSHALTYTFIDQNGCGGSATDTIHVLICSGINETAEEDIFIAYPNPVNDKLILQMQIPISEKTELKIYNAYGQLVHQQLLQKDQLQYNIPVNNFADGIYLLHIQNSEVNETFPVTVQR